MRRSRVARDAVVPGRDAMLEASFLNTSTQPQLVVQHAANETLAMSPSAR
jgi:hypothetical protein